MMDGQALTVWAARGAACFYAAGLAAPRHQRALWTAGFAFYLSHVVAAFAYLHRWSHGAAYADTARQTGRCLESIGAGGCI